MNKQRLVKSVGFHVRLVPPPLTRQGAVADEDWIVRNVEDDRVMLARTVVGHVKTLGIDQVYSFSTDPERDAGGVRHGFYHLLGQMIIDGPKVHFEPAPSPRTQNPGAPALPNPAQRDIYETAKAIIRASHKFREAFTQLRFRSIPAWESAQGDSRVVFEKRWGPLLQALSELETAIAEGAVLWGLKYKDRMVPVRESVIDLEFTLNGLLEGRDSQDRMLKERSVQSAQEFFGSGPQGDVIGKKLIAALQAIEEDAEKRLIR